jgi:hypothetical protein
MPVFSAAGNHCVGPGCTIRPGHYKTIMGKRIWNQRYGDYHVLTLDNCIFNLCNGYKFDRGNYYAERERWIVDQLEKNQDAKLTFLGVHIGMDSFTDLPGKSWFGAMKTYSKINGNWIDKYGVDMVLHGHWGKDNVSDHGSQGTTFVETRDITGKTGKAYRLIRVKDGRVKSFTYKGDAKLSITAGSLGVEFAAQNDGSVSANAATIRNDLDEHFEHGLVKFVMKKGDYSVSSEPTGARLGQSIDSDDGKYTICYVRYGIPAKQNSVITINSK